MASGFSYTGGRSRCFPFWQEFSKCYAGASKPEDCMAAKADYVECLFHGKEIQKARTIKAHYQARQAKDLETKRQEAESRAASGILSLGLISSEEEAGTKPSA